MCNGYNHKSGCDCGFGPREPGIGDPVPEGTGGGFQGRVHRGPRTSWWDQAIEDVDTLEKGLNEVGADQKTIRETIRAYREAGLPGSKKRHRKLDEEKKFKFMDILKRLVGYRKYKIEEKKTATIKVPLFTFGAPSVDNSKVIYEETTDFIKEKGWVISLIVPGIGMGASQEFRTQFTCEHSCEPGEFRTIFVPVRVRVSKLGIYENGKRIRDGGLRVTADGGKSARNYRHGIEPCSQKDCKGFSVPELHEFLLSRNSKKNISKFTDLLSRRGPVDTNIGLNILGITTMLKVRVSLEKRVKLEYDLPGGHNYHLYSLKKQLGIGWKISGPQHRKSQHRNNRGKTHGHSNRQNRKARTDQLHPRTVPLHQNGRRHPRGAGRSSSRH